MHEQPKNLFNMYKVNRIEKGFIEIKSENEIIERLLFLLHTEAGNQERILKFIDASFRLGTVSDAELLDQEYKTLLKKAAEVFQEISIYHTLTDLCKACWEISRAKLESKQF